MAIVQASITGVVTQVLVANGERVEAGQDVVILESMKMEIPIQAEQAGVVKEVFVASGSFVEEGETLLELE